MATARSSPVTSRSGSRAPTWSAKRSVTRPGSGCVLDGPSQGRPLAPESAARSGSTLLAADGHRPSRLCSPPLRQVAPGLLPGRRRSSRRPWIVSWIASSPAAIACCSPFWPGTRRFPSTGFCSTAGGASSHSMGQACRDGGTRLPAPSPRSRAANRSLRIPRGMGNPPQRRCALRPGTRPRLPAPAGRMKA